MKRYYGLFKFELKIFDNQSYMELKKKIWCDQLLQLLLRKPSFIKIHKVIFATQFHRKCCKYR